MSNSVIVSPHIDDGFISLASLADGKSVNHSRCQVVDVFSVSGYSLNAKGKLTIDEVSATRRREELINSKVTGSVVRFLPFLDAPLRGHTDLFSEAGLYSDWALAAEIKRTIIRMIEKSDTLYFPLGWGRHIDHVIVSKVGIELATSDGEGYNVFFYEDMPYAVDKNKSRNFSYINPKRDASKMVSSLLTVSCTNKLRICSAYKSQLHFRTMLRIILYAKKIRPVGSCVERVWQLRDRRYFRRLIDYSAERDS